MTNLIDILNPSSAVPHSLLGSSQDTDRHNTEKVGKRRGGVGKVLFDFNTEGHE